MDRLGVFAKFWAPGHVKTRLARTEGSHRAAALYLAFLETTLYRFARPEWHPAVVFTPAERREEFSTLVSPPWQIQPQVDGELGARLLHFFESALSDGYQRVVAIGSDSPNLPVEYVEDAFEVLQRVPVVLGPSEDGGYYLIGLNRRAPALFDNMNWGTPEVWSQTVARLQMTDTPFVQLPPWYDVDDRESLQRLFADLDGCSDDAALQSLQKQIRSTSVANHTANRDELP